MAADPASTKAMGDGSGQGLVLSLIFSVLLVLALGLLIVWMNIERTKLAYEVRVLQTEVSSRSELNGKLLVERDYLLSPYHLGRKAQELGLYAAKPGQIRRMPLKEQ